MKQISSETTGRLKAKPAQAGTQVSAPGSETPTNGASLSVRTTQRARTAVSLSGRVPAMTWPEALAVLEGGSLTRDQMVTMFDLMEVRWGKRTDDDRMARLDFEGYWRQLAPFPSEIVREAVDHWPGRFRPTPGELRGACQRLAGRLHDRKPRKPFVAPSLTDEELSERADRAQALVEHGRWGEMINWISELVEAELIKRGVEAGSIERAKSGKHRAEYPSYRDVGDGPRDSR